ncbi:MAG TPA: chitobiase/beta-hexosaminidase C-terminal domain-containing protein, partial [Spirochaetota bacterium]
MKKILSISLVVLCAAISMTCGGGSSTDPADPSVVSAPVFSPASGTYSADQSITLTSATAGATIYYTTDGSTPTTSSTAFNSSTPIAVAGNGKTMTINAIAVLSGMTDSEAASASYVINYAQVSTPTFSPSTGTYSTNQSVTINCSTTGATIYYTTNGDAPTTLSSVFTSGTPISVALSSGVTKTIKAYAVKAGMADSTVASAVYSYTPPSPSCSDGARNGTETDVDC